MGIYVPTLTCDSSILLSWTLRLVLTLWPGPVAGRPRARMVTADTSRKLAPQHGRTGVDRAAAQPSRVRCVGLRARAALQRGERAHVLGIMAVGDARYRIVLPVHVASLDGRLEPAEYFNVRHFAVFGRGLLVVRAGLVRLNLKIYYKLSRSNSEIILCLASAVWFL